jgi:hypothetical protein
MAHFSDYMEDKIVNAILRGQSLVAPSTIYVALFTSDPTDANTGLELADSNYARVDAALGDAVSTGWTAPSNGQTSNAKLLQFPPIADGTVTITHVGLFDAATGGNLLFHNALTSTKTLEIGDVLSYDIGAINIAIR